MYFGYENDLVYPFHISDQKFKDFMDFLLITDKNNSHYNYIKDFNRFIYNKTNIRTKNTFANIFYNILVMKKYCKNIKKLV